MKNVTKSKSKQDNELVINQRLVYVEHLMLCNWGRSEIYQEYKAKFDKSISMLDKDISKIKGEWRKAFDAERGQRIYQHCQKLNHLYAMSYKQKDYRACASILELIAKLDGSFVNKIELYDSPLDEVQILG